MELVYKATGYFLDEVSFPGGFLQIGRRNLSGLKRPTPWVHFAIADPALGQQCCSAVPSTTKVSK
jgi:hypothetical protein